MGEGGVQIRAGLLASKDLLKKPKKCTHPHRKWIERKLMLGSKITAWLLYPPCISQAMFLWAKWYPQPHSYNDRLSKHGLLPTKDFNQRESDSVPIARSLNKGPSPSLAVFSNILRSQMAIGLIHRNLLGSPIMCPIFNSHPDSSTWEEINTARQVGSESELQSHVFKSTLLTGYSLS